MEHGIMQVESTNSKGLIHDLHYFVLLGLHVKQFPWHYGASNKNYNIIINIINNK